MSLAKPSIHVRWLRGAVWCFLCGIAFGPLAGCTSFQSMCSSKWMEGTFGADSDPVDHVLARWDNRLRTAQDPVDYGSGITGMIGRVYLLSEQTKQMCDAHGTIVVGMLDMTPTSAGKRPVPIAEWVFDPETLKKLKSQDPHGNGYTVFLPWNEYRPEIKQVKLLVKYVTRKGDQHLADHSLVTLQPNDLLAATLRETVGPTLERQIDIQTPAPAKRPQAGVPFTPVQMDKIMPPINANRPSAAQQSADAPYQPIIMNPQARSPAPMNTTSTPLPIGADIPQSPTAETTVRYLPPPPR